MLKPPSRGMITLSIVTVTYQDIERFQSTARTMNWSSDASVEWIVVLPLDDLPTRAYIQTLQDVQHLRIIDDLGEGIYEAMNLGLRSAVGNYICFLNSGDLIINPDTVKRLISFLTLAEYEVIIVDVEIPWRDPQVVSMENFRGFSQFKVDSFISHQSVIAQTSLLSTLGGFNSKFRVAADTDLIVKISQNSTPGFFNQKVFYVEQPNFAAQKNRRARVEVILIAFLTSTGLNRIRIPLILVFRELSAVCEKLKGLMRG